MSGARLGARRRAFAWMREPGLHGWPRGFFFLGACGATVFVAESCLQLVTSALSLTQILGLSAALSALTWFAMRREPADPRRVTVALVAAACVALPARMGLHRRDLLERTASARPGMSAEELEAHFAGYERNALQFVPFGATAYGSPVVVYSHPRRPPWADGEHVTVVLDDTGCAKEFELRFDP